MIGTRLLGMFTNSRNKVPLIFQEESTECGLACLSAIIAFYGGRHDLTTLRRELGSASRGLSLGQIMMYAERLELHSRPLRTDISEMRYLRLPCILHWKFDHFV